MKRVLIFFITTLFIAIHGETPSFAQDFGINFSGFVKTDVYYDTRQTVNIREGHFLLYPQNELPDINGVDINAKDHFGILAIQSRLTGNITGPNVLNARSSALIEADFFGNENGNFADVNGFRLRHAIIRLNWENTELLVGQYWHPLFVTDCYPGVVSFNTGAPIQPFSRNPQIRLTHHMGNLKLILAALEQRDFTSNGPDGGNSKYLRNAVLPDLNLQLQYLHTWDETNQFLIGIGGEYKQLVPRLSYNDGPDTYYTGNDKVKSAAFTAYTKLVTRPVTLKAYTIYGSNLFDLVMTSGYAVTSVSGTNERAFTYSPKKNFSLWAELITSGNVQFGLFGGYTKNLGTEDVNTGVYYSRGNNINSVIRVSPRLVFNAERLRIAAEVEYTAAQYGTANEKGVVDSNLNTIANVRSLLAFYYFF